MRGIKTVITEEMRRDIISLYSDAKNPTHVSALSKQFGIDRKVIATLLDDSGIERRKRKMDASKRMKIIGLLRDGKSNSEIARQMRVGSDTIKSISRSMPLESGADQRPQDEPVGELVSGSTPETQVRSHLITIDRDTVVGHICTSSESAVLGSLLRETIDVVVDLNNVTLAYAGRRAADDVELQGGLSKLSDVTQRLAIRSRSLRGLESSLSREISDLKRGLKE